jgi:H+-transporting ATPase
LKGCQVVHFQPFDPVHKRTEATVKGADEKEFKATKGAPLFKRNYDKHTSTTAV